MVIAGNCSDRDVYEALNKLKEKNLEKDFHRNSRENNREIISRKEDQARPA